MREVRRDTRFEAELREALRLELTTARVGVAAPQVRGRIAARQRSRRTTQILLVAVALGVALVGGLVLAGRLVGPPPIDGEPATVAAIEPASGDLVVAQVWPDGRREERWRLPNGLERVREAADDPLATGLSADAVASAGPNGWLAIALPQRDVLLFRDPGATASYESMALGGEVAAGWFGWADDGRLVLVGADPTGDRLEARLFDPATSVETAVPLPEGVTPDWARGELQPLRWNADGTVVARQMQQATFTSTIGSLDLGAEPPTFVAGRPASIRVITGLEPREAPDGSQPATDCHDDRPISGCAGLIPWGDPPVSATWLVVRPEEAITDVVRTADGSGLLVVVRATDEDRGRLVWATAPGEWRDAVAFAAPAYSPETSGLAYLAGIARSGRTVALWIEGSLLIADLETGVATTLPSGTVFVGWPEAPTVATDDLATAATCRVAGVDDAARISLSTAGSTSPASEGQLPVVGDRADADPWRVGQVSDLEPTTVETSGRLVLALPEGVCLEAALVESVARESMAGSVPGKLMARTPLDGTQAGLLSVPAPESVGDWIMRVRIWLVGADRERTLLYHVVTSSAAVLVAGPTPTGL